MFSGHVFSSGVNGCSVVGWGLNRWAVLAGRSVVNIGTLDGRAVLEVCAVLNGCSDSRPGGQVMT